MEHPGSFFKSLMGYEIIIECFFAVEIVIACYVCVFCYVARSACFGEKKNVLMLKELPKHLVSNVDGDSTRYHSHAQCSRALHIDTSAIHHVVRRAISGSQGSSFSTAEQR